MPRDTKGQVIDAERIARRAYFATIEEIARQQAELIEIDALRRMFGDKALAPVKLLRSSQGALGRAKETMERLEQKTRENLEENYKVATFFEAMFEQQNTADIDALVAYLRERYQS